MFSVPNIPDNSNRIVMLIGIVFIIASWFMVNNSDSEQNLLINQKNHFIDSLNIMNMETESLKSDLLDKDTVLAMKYNRKQLISGDSSMLHFNRIIRGDSISTLQTDTLKKYWDVWSSQNDRIKILLKRIDFINSDLKRNAQSFSETLTVVLLVLGVLIFLFGLKQLENRETQNTEILLRQNASLPLVYPECQSCALKFSPLVTHGTNKDQSINYAFCSICFSEGKFTNENLSLADMKNKVSEKVNGLGKRRQKVILNSLEKLERWKKDRF